MPFKPGESGNPAGKPRGAENRLTRKAKYYAEKLIDEMKSIGVAEIAKTGKMSDYVNLLKTLLPKDFNISGNLTVKNDRIDLSKLTVDELKQLRDLHQKCITESD